MGELVLVERRADGVALVTLNNGKVNALSRAQERWTNFALVDWNAAASGHPEYMAS